jgi:hypothetical protein
MSRKQLIWIFASIALALALVVLYQQYTIQSQSSDWSSNTKSVRRQMMIEQQSWSIVTGEVVSSQTGDIATGTTTTGATTQVVSSTDNSCVTSYQALIDRIQWLWETSESDTPQALADTVGLWYCNGSTPKESDFLSITSNGQKFSYDPTISGGALKLDSTTIIPDFIKTCGDRCPAVQAIRTVRSDNKYVVLETTQPRSYQSSFRLVSTTNGTTMLYWAALNFVDPVASYAWSKDGHFAFIGSAGRSTDTHIVQPKWFPTTTQVPDEIDTPVALSIAWDTLVVLYDRNPTNTDLTDRYTKTYNISELNATTTLSGAVQQ